MRVVEIKSTEQMFSLFCTFILCSDIIYDTIGIMNVQEDRRFIMNKCSYLK